MKSKIQQIRSEGYKTLISIIIIGVAVYLGFTPLFDKINGGVAGAVLGASFSAIFVIVLTMYLLNKQTEIEQESKKGERIFEQKIKLYDQLIADTEKMLRDGKITKEIEMQKIPFVLIRLQMIGNDEAIKAYMPIYKQINSLFEETQGDEVEITVKARGNILSALSEFSRKCRVDLGVLDVEVDEGLFKETKDIIDNSEGIRRGKTEFMKGGIEEFLQACKEKGRSPELIESTKKLYENLMRHYHSIVIDIPDFTQTQSQAKLKVKSEKGVFCDITLQKKGIRIGNICKSPRWDFKQLKFPGLFFKHDMEHTRKLKVDGITQIDQRELEEILFVLDESKKVLEENKGMKDYKKEAKKGDLEAGKKLEELMSEDYILELNLNNK
tara:strand:+ start:1095 stop:2243 length:1149 start_codon:yes stop_codon:yes gene_type:complete